MACRTAYKICPGDRVVKHDTVPEAATGRTLRIVVCDAQITALPAR